MSVVKELSDVESAAGRPRRSLVEADKQRSHQVMSSQISKQPLTGLGVVVRHTQHMACGGKGCNDNDVTHRCTGSQKCGYEWLKSFT